MKRKTFQLLIGLLSLSVISGCDYSTQNESVNEETAASLNLADNEAGQAVRQAIEWAGGWDAWQDKKSLSYTKVIQYFDSTGNQEREVRQLHQYRLQPFAVRISWQDAGDDYVIINNGEQAWKLRNDTVMTAQADVNNAWNASFGSHYVMGMPFKLADPGTVLTYEGTDTLHNGKVVHSIKIDYEEGAGSAAGMHHWWYYLAVEDNSLAANFLDYGDGYTYTQYEAFTEVDGIKLNKERHSYTSNADRELLFRRTLYRNEDVRLSETPPAADLFELPGSVVQ